MANKLAGNIKKNDTLKINGECLLVTFSRKHRRYTGFQLIQGFWGGDESTKCIELEFRCNEILEVK